MSSEVQAIPFSETKILLTAIQPQSADAVSPSANLWTVWLAPLASAGLLYLSFFPVAWGWLAWVALVPFLCLVRAPGQLDRSRPSSRRALGRLYLAAWLGGLVFFWSALQWMRVADLRMYITWAALATYCACYIPLGLYLVRLLDRRTRLPLVLTFPMVWVALEYFRYGCAGSFFSLLTGSHQHDYPGGFSWYFLGHTQHDFLELIQTADLTGVYGVSFLVAGVNALLFEILYARTWFRLTFIYANTPPPQSRMGLLVQGLGVVGLLLAALGYGVWRLGQDTVKPGPRLAFLQGNVDQRIRTATSMPESAERNAARETVKEHYSRLATIASRQQIDLIVWPETSYPATWEEVEPGGPWGSSRELAHELIDKWPAPMLLGMSAAVLGQDRKIRGYNSAILIDRQARRQGRYDKIHRVPFGEYVPFRNWMPWLNNLAPYDFDYSVSPGEQFTRFSLLGKDGSPAFRFGTIICYEDTDPAMARPYVSGEGPPVSFLLNISNDGWFDGTSEHDQHLAICRFRAVECRRSVGRAVNMGISAIIDSNGRVLAPTTTHQQGVLVWEVPEKASELPMSRWHEYKKTAGVLLASMPIDTRGSIYARWGDWFAAGCGALLLLSLAWIAVQRHNRDALRLRGEV